jgi:trehalose 6-phosphate synthase
VIASAAEGRLQALLDSKAAPEVVAYFNRLTQDERLYAIGYCDAPGSLIATPLFPSSITCDSLASFLQGRQLLESAGRSLHVTVRNVDPQGAPGRYLVLLHDMSFMADRSRESKKYLFYLFIGLGVVVSLITVIVAQLSWRGWVQGIRAIVYGDALLRPLQPTPSAELHPVVRDLRLLIRDIEASHAPREGDTAEWTPDALRTLLRTHLRSQEVIVEANREPYLHVRDGGVLEIKRPASGVVTALEPVMRACAGTWIAHGSASGDRASVDKHDRVAVPPDAPEYQLRRVWMTPEEEAGYYYGFANEGLWPLCHIAHVRPVFRSSDWQMYQRVNERFADAVVQEARTEDPIVLVQDYHFALLPQYIRKRLPNATIITFWHIPWPNPESFAICPWREEVLEGLLGSSILGFHTQFHCNNFVDTVDRLLEARVDRETFSVTSGGESTLVKRYPISIEWPPPPAMTAVPIEACRSRVRARHGLPATQLLGVGVERLDYTKGIEERFRAVERLLERYPEWIGRFTFIQIAAPSRTRIPEYQSYQQRVRSLADAINERFAGAGAPAIVLCVEHFAPAAVYEHYRAAELCFVSSLHDGMNLVAKEFVASRDDERGALVLSRFTGAARELPEALIVNPYDPDECADGLRVALEMPEAEQRDRMRVMRGLLREFNVYRWAGRMLMDATTIRRRERLRGRSSEVGR